jgi:molybdopterin-guanine dinucleotide biosynthesis protein B
MSIPVLQVVGFKDSGKTTLIESLLSACRQADCRAGVIKHHGHGGGLNEHDQRKDTGRFRKNGAVVSGVTANGELEMRFINDAPWQAEQLVRLYQHLPVDMILIEGFKSASYSKVVMVKGKEDLKVLGQLDNIVAVVTWDRELYFPEGRQIFHISEERRYIPWLLSRLGVKRHD